jgi:uncharacterized protein YkwD
VIPNGAFGKNAMAIFVVHVVIPTFKHVLAALANAGLRSPGGRRLTISLLGALAIGVLPAVPGTAPSAVHIATTPAASSGWLDRLNAWRANASLSSLTENSLWSQGDYDHALYMVKNDLVTHYETAGTPYYTTAGDTAAQNSNIQVSSTTSTSDQQAIDWWMAAPFHAMGMMDPRLTQTGFGSYREVKSGWQEGAALDTLRGNSFTGGQYPVFFPGNNSTEPLTTYNGGEFPDPLQACPGYSAPTGLPVFIQVGGNVATTAGPAHSFTGNGVALEHCVIDSSNPSVGTNLRGRGGVILIPRQPLQNGVRYVVALMVNGVSYTWSFTVGSLVTSGTPSLGAVLAGRPIVGDYDGDGKADLALVGAGGTSVAMSTGSAFSKPSSWASIPFYGSVATLGGNVTGDGKADLVAVNAGQTFVMPSTGTAFGPAQSWATVPFYGARGTFLADVNGDLKADLVAINDSSIWVMLSSGTGFGAPTGWSSTLFYGSVTTTVGDVSGDGKADLVAVNSWSTWVMTSTGTGFAAPALWSNQPFYGTVITTTGDVTGDGKADLVALNSGNAWVMTSTGTGFAAPAGWSGTAFYGQLATLRGDVNGDGKVDMLAVNNLSVWVEPSTGAALSTPALWL